MSDTWGIANRTCASFAAFRLSRDGVPIGDSRLKVILGAQSYAELDALVAVSDGARVGQAPSRGALILWMEGEKIYSPDSPFDDGSIGEAGPGGHVAYIESVDQAGNITVEDYSASTGSWSSLVVSLETGAVVHFPASLPPRLSPAPPPSSNTPARPPVPPVEPPTQREIPTQGGLDAPAVLWPTAVMTTVRVPRAGVMAAQMVKGTQRVALSPRRVRAGANALSWPRPARIGVGKWRLILRYRANNGVGRVTTKFITVRPAPVSKSQVSTSGGRIAVSLTSRARGVAKASLVRNGKRTALASRSVRANRSTITWNPSARGSYVLEVRVSSTGRADSLVRSRITLR
ncbi:CHAP domain-containing protein [Miltoncostaea oceani]|uniref:CHAP domain-containing protein n=1 Tax=Miltoncostaea oceani TaxID=2843216 RepID=UPI001C3E6104|nr:CHAP domain-containing protein [Miltoncostaea oceani]